MRGGKPADPPPRPRATNLPSAFAAAHAPRPADAPIVASPALLEVRGKGRAP